MNRAKTTGHETNPIQYQHSMYQELIRQKIFANDVWQQSNQRQEQKQGQEFD